MRTVPRSQWGQPVIIRGGTRDQAADIGTEHRLSDRVIAEIDRRLSAAKSSVSGYRIVPIPLEELRQLISVDTEAGVARWIKGRLTAKTAGSMRTHGYRAILFKGREYLLHRIIWAFHYGVSSFGVIDHINGDMTDNRIANLRAAEQRENQGNRRKDSDATTSPYKGVHRLKNGRFRATIGISGGLVIGTFGSEEEAARAYDAAALRVFGEFARLNLPPVSSPVRNDLSLTDKLAPAQAAAPLFFHSLGDAPNRQERGVSQADPRHLESSLLATVNPSQAGHPKCRTSSPKIESISPENRSVES